MKLYLPLPDNPKTGKGFFMTRLAKQLSNLDVQITTPDQPHDIALHFTKIKTETKAKYNVIRYDGVYHNTAQDYKTMNRSMSKFLEQVDGVIYQSQFGKAMCDKYLGTYDGPTAIVFNGADPQHYDDIDQAQSPYVHNILAASRWRPHKRLRTIIESFLLADIKDSCLWVAGELKDSGLKPSEITKYKSKPNIQFLDRITQQQMSKYLKLCQTALHLCWFDCCPNSVVEAISAKCAVVSNNVGGTPELVKPSNGLVCGIDKPYDLKPVDLYNPPSIDLNKVAQAIHAAILPRPVYTGHIDIRHIAAKYKQFLEEVLKCRP